MAEDHMDMDVDTTDAAAGQNTDIQSGIHHNTPPTDLLQTQDADYPMRDCSQDDDGQDIYTAGTGTQGSGQTQDEMKHHTDRAHSPDPQKLIQPAQLTNTYLSEVDEKEMKHGVAGAVTKQPKGFDAQYHLNMRQGHVDLYTAGTVHQGSGQTQDDTNHQSFLKDQTHSSDAHALMHNRQFPNVQGVADAVIPTVTKKPIGFEGLMFSQDLYTAGIVDQGSGQSQDDTNHQNFLKDQTHSPDSQKWMHNNQFPNVQGVADAVVPTVTKPIGFEGKMFSQMRPDHADREPVGDQGSGPAQKVPMDQSLDSQRIEDLHRGPAGDQGSGPTRKFTMDRTYSLDSWRNEQTPPSSSSDDQFSNGQDSCKGGNDSQPSAPLDLATFVIKVDWREPFPERWRATLQKAIQSWLMKLEENTSVHHLELMDDLSYAEVQITPSTALEAIKKLKSIPLTFKNEKKEVTALICPDEMRSVTGPQKPSMPDKNRISSPQVNRAPASEDKNNVEHVSATNSGVPVPLYLFWYMNHAYRKELEQIEKEHGVSVCAEVSVSINPTKSSSPDSVSKATEDFHKLVQGCGGNFNEAAINHNHMDSDIVKQALDHIQSEKEKMMFTMSARNGLFFGPKQFTNMIKREVGETRPESKFNDKSRQMSKDNSFSPQSRSSLDMDTKDLPAQLKMDTVHWDLMKLSYKEQLSQLETKYGVSFHEDKQQNNLTITVQAQSKGAQCVNLESHAIRALTRLYQKLASAAVTCELKNSKDETPVASALEKLQQQLHCVVLSRSRLVGLPEHLGPAIADIEKTLPKSVFDDKKKKSIGYSGDIPHARGIKWHQPPDYGSGAVGGSGWDERVNLRRRSEADTGFNEESQDSSRHESKAAHAEEEKCVICMDSFTDKKKLKCGHEFCRDCISSSEKSLGSICPVCKEVYGMLEGNQPRGTMKVTKSRSSLPGYPDCGTIEINYSIPDGVQTEKHPNPGQRYYGTHRQAFLPENREGKEVLALLQKAFHQKLIFTVGRSTTTGAENAVIWNDIQHKTSTYGGPERYGYPDPGYLKRVRDELKAKGIE